LFDWDLLPHLNTSSSPLLSCSLSNLSDTPLLRVLLRWLAAWLSTLLAVDREAARLMIFFTALRNISLNGVSICR
jgi:hypothetical protein